MTAEDMKTIEEKIKQFVGDPENITQAMAMLKVGADKGDPIEVIMERTLADALFRFHGIPVNQTNG